MRVTEWVSGFRNHPYLSIAADAVRATRSGLGAAVRGRRNGTSDQSEAWGPTDGPAPTDGTTRSPVVSFDTYGEGRKLFGEVQFWTPRDGGAILGAWEINEQSGQCGVLDRDPNRFWLGRKPYWSSDGQRHTHLVLSDEVEAALWNSFRSLLVEYQRMNLGVVSDQDPGKPPFDDDPAPGSADVGDVITVPVANETSFLPARFQPWRPEDSGVVYVAWQIGEREGSTGILHSAGLWLGENERVISPSGASSPFVYIDDRETETVLQGEITKLHERGVGEGLESGNVNEIAKAPHPDSPGQNNDLSSGIEVGEEGNE